MNGGVRLGRGACRDVPPYAVFWRVVAAAVAWFTQLLIGDCDRREGTPGNSGMFAARTRRSASARAIPGSSGRALNDGTGMGTQFGLSRSCALPFNARGLISRGLEQKRAIFASFLTLNHLDFSVLGRKWPKKLIGKGKGVTKVKWSQWLLPQTQPSDNVWDRVESVPTMHQEIKSAASSPRPRDERAREFRRD